MVMQHVWSKGVSSFKFRAKPDFNICSRRRLFCGLGVAETGNLKLQTSSLAFRNQNGQLDAAVFLEFHSEIQLLCPAIWLACHLGEPSQPDRDFKTSPQFIYAASSHGLVCSR